MNTKEKRLVIKEQLKAEAKKISKLKVECKEGQRGTNKGPRVWQDQVESASWTWRHKHIAYCLLRGRKIEEIERKVREGNEPNRKLIEQYIEEFTREVSDD